MKIEIRTVAMAAVLAAASITPAVAQPGGPAPASDTRGLSLGLYLNGSALQFEDSDEAESGGGFSLHAGYGFTDHLAVFMRLNGAEIESSDVEGDSYALAHVDIGARYSFGGPAAALRPFVQGALNARAFAYDLGTEGTLEARGSGFSGGAGLEYFFSRSLAVEGALSFSSGTFSEGRVGDGEWVDLEDEALDAVSTRVDLGITWHP